MADRVGFSRGGDAICRESSRAESSPLEKLGRAGEARTSKLTTLVPPHRGVNDVAKVFSYPPYRPEAGLWTKVVKACSSDALVLLLLHLKEKRLLGTVLYTSGTAAVRDAGGAKGPATYARRHLEAAGQTRARATRRLNKLGGGGRVDLLRNRIFLCGRTTKAW